MTFKFLGKKPHVCGTFCIQDYCRERKENEKHFRGALIEAAEAIEQQRTSENNTFMKGDTFMFNLRKMVLVSAGEE